MENELKKFLDNKGLTVADIERMTGLPYMTIRHHVRGRNLPSLEAALKYEQVLGIPVSTWSKKETSKLKQ